MNEDSAEKKINDSVEAILSEMTLEEKLAQLGSIGPKNILEGEKFSPAKAREKLEHGIGQISRIAGASGLEPEKAARAANELQEFLLEETESSIPAMIYEECLSGYMGKRGTVYPQTIGLGSTWSPELIEKMGKEISKQIRAMGGHLGAPIADVIRDMRWGRVEECFGEDQYLVSELITAYVQGLQGDDLTEGVIAILKHLGGHGLHEGGRNHAPVNISPRELRENYLLPFEAAIRVGNAKSVMNAYHDIDGTPCACSRELLTEILREEWGFDGIVVSDYFSIEMLHTEHKVAEDKKKAAIKALAAGLDIELPETNCYGNYLREAVQEGLISMEVIDEAVRRHLRVKMKLGLFQDPYVAPDKCKDVFETKKQRELARKLACKSMVLLKNENDLLPLAKDLKSIAVIGPSAGSTRNLLGDYAYSAHVDSPEDAVEVISILEGIEETVSEETELKHAPGCSIMGESREGFAEAIAVAEESDVAIVVVGGKSGLSGLSENDPVEEETVDFQETNFAREMKNTTDTTGEHHDRTDLQLPGVQEELLKEIHKTGTPVIVVLVNGRPLSVNWAAENVPAIIEAWLPGEEGGNAVADVLFGDYNPGGKLPVSIPRTVGQTPINYNRKHLSCYRDYVFSSNEPLYPFGYGLSYTSFAYSDLKIEVKEASAEVETSVKVKNTGSYAGEEVVQLYFNDEYASRTRPVKELKGFKRISLKPGEEKEIRFKTSVDQLAFYNQDMELIVEPGTFTVMVGSASNDIRLEGKFELTGKVRKIAGERNFFSKVIVE